MNYGRLGCLIVILMMMMMMMRNVARERSVARPKSRLVVFVLSILALLYIGLYLLFIHIDTTRSLIEDNSTHNDGQRKSINRQSINRNYGQFSKNSNLQPFTVSNFIFCVTHIYIYIYIL